LVADADQAELMGAVGEAVWRGEAFEVAVFEWPPGPLSGDGAERDVGEWTCWLRDGSEPGIVVALEGMAERLLIPLATEGLTEVETMRAAVLLTMSLQRSIEIGDAGWMPAGDLAALLGASVEPTEPAEPPEPVEPPPPEEPVVEPVVEPPVPSEGPAVQLGVAAGPALRPAAGSSALGATARLSVVRGPWLGPGLVVGIEALGGLEPESYGVSVFRATVAGRWQLTPERGRWWFPLGLGLGAAFTSARIADPFDGAAQVVVPPILLADVGVARRLGSRVSLALTVQLSVDLIPVRVLVQGDGIEVSADLHPFVLLPRLELVFHPGPR
jgi:hypothetical protein